MQKRWYVLLVLITWLVGLALSACGMTSSSLQAEATFAPPSTPGSLLPRPATAISAQTANQVQQRVRLGHGKVLGVDYAPDGRRLAVATSAGIGLYDAQTLTLERFIPTANQVTDVVFAPDGATLASSSPLRVWRASDGKLLLKLQGSSVAFAPDGSLLASAGKHEIWLWRASDGKLLRTLGEQRGGVKSLAFSPDGTLLVSGSTGLYDDDSVLLWQVSDGKLLQKLEDHKDTVASVAFTPDGTTLATGSYDRTVRLWRVKDGELLHTLKGHKDYVHSVAFSPDGQTLASGSADGQVRLWQVSNGKLAHTLKGDASRVTGVAFSPDGTNLAVGARAHWSKGGWGKLQVWRLNDRQLLRELEVHMGVVESVAFSPDGTLLASAGMWDGAIRLWRVSDGALLGKMTLKHEGGFTTSSVGVSDIAFAPDAQVLAAAADGRVLLWRVADGKLLDKTDILGPVLSVAFAPQASPDGMLLATGKDKHVALWRVAEGKLEHLRDLKGHTGVVESVAWAADGTLASTARGDLPKNIDDYTVRLWQVSQCMPGAASPGQSAECGTLLHTLDLQPKVGGVESVALSPAGDLLAVTLGNKVLLWRVADETLLGTLEGHSSGVYGLAFSPDGTTLASGAWDNTLRLWQVAGCARQSRGCGAPLHTLSGHTDYVNSVAFAPDGVWLASGSYDGTLRLWGTGR